MVGKDCVCEVLKVKGQIGGGCVCGRLPRFAAEGRECVLRSTGQLRGGGGAASGKIGMG